MKDTPMITIALSKGRIFEETLPLLQAAGITPLEAPEPTRKLILSTNRADVRLIIVRASDVRPMYNTALLIWGSLARMSSTNMAASACTSRWI